MTGLAIAAVALLLGNAMLSGAPRRRPPSAAERRVRAGPRLGGRSRRVFAVCAVLGSLAVFGLLGLLVPLVAGGRRVLQRRRRERSREAQIARTLPELADLLGVAVGAGRSVPASCELAASHLRTGVVGDALATMGQRLRAGGGFASTMLAFEHELGARVRPLTAVLLAGERDGAPLAEGLRATARDLRERRRRELEARARRLPVLLLFPLVFCVLPAYALLTVVPLVAESISGLGAG